MAACICGHSSVITVSNYMGAEGEEIEDREGNLSGRREWIQVSLHNPYLKILKSQMAHLWKEGEDRAGGRRFQSQLGRDHQYFDLIQACISLHAHLWKI